MLSPYENIIIGNFLYGLGLLMGREPNAVDGCINLTQQTKLDGVLGDLMLQFTTAWRLIEFKRHGARMKKEHAKVELFRGAISDSAALEHASRTVHWYVESGVQGPEGTLRASQFTSRVRPYLDLREEGGISMEKFAQDTVREACHGEQLAKDDLALYMDLVRAFGCLDGYNTAGLLVGISSSGGLAYVPLENVADLSETASRLAERAKEKELAHLRREADAARGPFSQLMREYLEQDVLEIQRTAPAKAEGQELGL